MSRSKGKKVTNIEFNQKLSQKKENFIIALSESLGIISTACKKIGITRPTYYAWIREDEEFKERCEHITQDTGDLVESKLLEKIKEGETTAIIFYCKTKLKSRGYVERFEQNIKDISMEKITEHDEEIIERALQRRMQRVEVHANKN